MFDRIYLIVELLGTIAFALSGVLVAREKRMDLFGAIVLGGATAVGGGCTRDLLLGSTPPQMFLHPIYVLTAFIASVLCFFFFYLRIDRIVHPQGTFHELLFNLTDSFGLGVFAVSGTEAAIRCGYEGNMFLAVFVGTLTAVGGGILRDMLAGQMPLIMRKRVYAVAAIFGAAIYYLCDRITDDSKILASLAGIFLTVLIRAMAIHYRWNLPRFPEE